MSIHDDISNDRPEGHDPLKAQLIREATAERQAVTPMLHGQILRRVHRGRADRPARKTRLVPALPRIAAAILLAAGGFVAWRATRSHSTSITIPPPKVVEIIPPRLPEVRHVASAEAQSPFDVKINAGNILSAKLWPPRITISLPIGVVSDFPEPRELPRVQPAPKTGSSPWLLAAIEQPANDAQSELADLIPPNFRELAGLVKFIR